MKTNVFIPRLILLSLLGASTTGASPADGNWLWISPGRNGAPDKENILSLHAEGARLAGKISAPGADGQPADTPIALGEVRGDALSFAVIREVSGGRLTNRYSAKVAGDRLVGTIESIRNGQPAAREWTAQRNGDRSVAAAVPAPKPGYDEAGHKIVNETRYRALPVAEVEKYLANHPDTIILDLRPPAAYAAGHLPNARSLDVTDDATYRDALKPLDKTKRYLVHSVSGGYRTVRVFEYFQEHGFEHAAAIEGGFQAWAAAGKPVVK